jgi:SOS-response transcriptional repressor LexA
MPRPSRLDEAKEKLRAHYAAHGGMPSIQAFAELMGYASPSSAHDVTNALVKQGFLAKDERGGRLLPGPLFGPKRSRAPSIPAELLEALPKGVELEVLRVPKGSSLAADGVMAGDYLVLAPADRTDLSGTLLLARGRQRVLADKPSDGWKVAAVVVAQFRSYRS